MFDRKNFDADAKIEYFTSLYNSLGVRTLCEERIAALFANCDSYLDAVSVSPERKSIIKSFADSLLNRLA